MGCGVSKSEVPNKQDFIKTKKYKKIRNIEYIVSKMIFLPEYITDFFTNIFINFNFEYFLKLCKFYIPLANFVPTS